jgi:hypothetical protein
MRVDRELRLSNSRGIGALIPTTDWPNFGRGLAAQFALGLGSGLYRVFHCRSLCRLHFYRTWTQWLSPLARKRGSWLAVG